MSNTYYIEYGRVIEAARGAEPETKAFLLAERVGLFARELIQHGIPGWEGEWIADAVYKHARRSAHIARWASYRYTKGGTLVSELL